MTSWHEWIYVKEQKGCAENGVMHLYMSRKEMQICVHWEGGPAEKRCRLSGFHSTARKQGKHTVGMLLAQLRNHGSTLQGYEHSICWFEKATTDGAKDNWAGIDTTSYFFHNKWWTRLVKTGRKTEGQKGSAKPGTSYPSCELPEQPHTYCGNLSLLYLLFCKMGNLEL